MLQTIPIPPFHFEVMIFPLVSTIFNSLCVTVVEIGYRQTVTVESSRSRGSCIVFSKDVIRLLYMVVVSWAGFGNQAMGGGGGGGQTMKAHLSAARLT